MKHSNSTNYKTKEIDRKIISLAWPAVLSNITVPLLGLSDTFISGHLGDERYLAAMAAGTTMVNTLYWLFGFLRMGTTGLTANAFGAGDNKTQAAVFTRGMAIALTAGMILALCAPLLSGIILALMKIPEEVALPASEYFRINMLGAPAILATMVVTGRLIGRQNTLFTMLTAISVNILNIVLSMLLVFCFDTGFKGVAIGTTAANWAGLLIALLLAAKQSAGEKMLTPLREIFRGGGLSTFFSVNAWLFARSACMMAVTFAMTSFAGQIGTTALAANAVLMQFFIFFSYFMDGFAFSGEALCGRFSGSGERDMLRLTIRRLMVAGLVMTVVFSSLYALTSTGIASLLSDSHKVVEKVASLKIICVLLPAASVAAFIFDGIFIGLTRTRDMMLSTLGGMILFFAVRYALLPTDLMPETALWTAFISFLATRGIVLALRLWRYSIIMS